MISDVAQQVESVKIPPLIVSDEPLPLRPFMTKPHGDAILPHDKQYFNYRHSRAKFSYRRSIWKIEKQQVQNSFS